MAISSWKGSHHLNEIVKIWQPPTWNAKFTIAGAPQNVLDTTSVPCYGDARYPLYMGLLVVLSPTNAMHVQEKVVLSCPRSLQH